uniref:Uncharacterized protein n=1 Tax=Attheya septentrionalis TaxID=420275 RepID=A0A7S2UPT8_9STRA|mmetsp:Transcript_7300/g.13102  ORF Transcript_7300/g.13102 Transcript_7300/m.13102 type:complete len:361 (+) Transcript_7300:98-1180(+)
MQTQTAHLRRTASSRAQTTVPLGAGDDVVNSRKRIVRRTRRKKVPRRQNALLLQVMVIGPCLLGIFFLGRRLLFSRGDVTNPLPPSPLKAAKHTEKSILPKIKPGQVVPFSYALNAARVGLPTNLRDDMLAYCDRLGITDRFHELTGDNPLEPDEKHVENFNGTNWSVWRPAGHWHSNIHWIDPQDDGAQQSFLSELGASGFDIILDAIGTYYGLDTITCHEVSFFALSYSASNPYLHHDFHETGGKGFNVIFPLLLVEGSTPEVDIEDQNTLELHGVQYEYNAAVVLGDNAKHRSAPVEYTENGGMRLSVSVYFSDITEDNVDKFLSEYTPSVPELDHDSLLAKRGLHWGGGKHLPRPK